MKQKPQKSTIRVLGGALKGRALKMAALETTRSSKAILKESLFNTLCGDICGAHFVEFFAGSGSIGIEALSRGAASATFFEKDRASFAVLQENLKICSSGVLGGAASGELAQITAVFGDVFAEFEGALKSLNAPAIGYIDPPFDIRENFSDIYARCFELISRLNPSVFNLIIIEHSSRASLPPQIGAFSCIKTRRFGASSISYFAP